jgi:N6-adenosine-specific RNA methylase IME4
MNALATLSRATRMLAEVSSASEAKQVMDIASAAEHYARKHQLGEQAIAHAHAIKIDAQGMLGQFLAEMQKHPPGRQPHIGPTDGPISEPLTIEELGLTKNLSADSQLLARIKEEQPEAFDEIRNQEKSLVQLKRELKEQQREERRQENREKIAQSPNIFEAGVRFATIVVDPPWDFADEGDVDPLGRSRPTYAQMSLDEITQLPIESLADIDCHLYLWITNRSLPKGFGLLDAWGFRYITCLTWCKPSFGIGNYFRGSTEQILFAVKGQQPLRRKDAGTWFTAPRGPDGHSSKPDEFYALVESCSPGPYIDIFNRRPREDWAVWGAEAMTDAAV